MAVERTNNNYILADYMKLPYKVEVVRDQCNGEPCYMARHPELYGCMAQGNTPQEAIANLQAAREDYIAALLEEGIDVPLPELSEIR